MSAGKRLNDGKKENREAAHSEGSLHLYNPGLNDLNKSACANARAPPHARSVSVTLTQSAFASTC